MKCPEYIRNALKQRAKCAERFTYYDLIIHKFIEKNQIDVEPYDIGGGCESYVNPDSSSLRIYNAIMNK